MTLIFFFFFTFNYLPSDALTICYWFWFSDTVKYDEKFIHTYRRLWLLALQTWYSDSAVEQFCNLCNLFSLLLCLCVTIICDFCSLQCGAHVPLPAIWFLRWPVPGVSHLFLSFSQKFLTYFLTISQKFPVSQLFLTYFHLFLSYFTVISHFSIISHLILEYFPNVSHF